MGSICNKENGGFLRVLKEFPVIPSVPCNSFLWAQKEFLRAKRNLEPRRPQSIPPQHHHEDTQPLLLPNTTNTAAAQSHCRSALLPRCCPKQHLGHWFEGNWLALTVTFRRFGVMRNQFCPSTRTNLSFANNYSSSSPLCQIIPLRNAAVYL